MHYGTSSTQDVQLPINYTRLFSIVSSIWILVILNVISLQRDKASSKNHATIIYKMSALERSTTPNTCLTFDQYNSFFTNHNLNALQ